MHSSLKTRLLQCRHQQTPPSSPTLLQTSIQRILGLRVMVTGRRSFIALVDRTLDSGLVTPTQASYTSLITANSPRSTNTMQGFTKILLLRVISSLSR